MEGCPPGMAGGTSDNPEAQEVADAWVGPGEEAEEEAVAEAGAALGGEVGDADGDGVVGDADQCPDQPGPADNQGCPRAVSGGGPGTIQGGQRRPEFDDSDFPPGQRAIVENCMICDWLEEQGGRTYSDTEATPGIGLEVEVLSLRTAEGLSDVACYASLQSSPWERVPGDQDEFFDPLGEGFWNVADYLGGEHGQGVTVPEGEPLRIDVRCYGRQGDMLTPSLHLGEVIREHGPADWNGQTFTARGQEGANWFDVAYRICGIPCEDNVIPPPYDLRIIRNESYGVISYVLSWSWHGDATAIDGFHIYRDGNLIATEYGADHPFTILSQSTVEPECSDEYRFEVRAVKGTQESAPSNPAFSAATASCRDRNELEVAGVTLPTLQRADLTVDLNYWYDGDHGDQVFIFALPLQGGRPPCWEFSGCPVEFHDLFSLATATVPTGGGDTRVHVYYGGAEPMVTDGLRLVMMDEDNELFYTRDVSLAVQWYPSGPDLAWSGINVLSPARQVEGQTMHDLTFQVVNRGYARLLWTPSLNIRLGNGQLAIPTEDWDDVWLTPGGSASIVWSVPEDIWLALAPTYQVTLDPDNVIAELNEGNNTFAGTVSRLRITYEAVAFFNHGKEIRILRDTEGNPDGFVGPGGQLLALIPGAPGPWLYGEMLQFKGAVRDDWVDNWAHNDFYRPHEEGWGVPISTNPTAPLWRDLAGAFRIIRETCYEEGYIDSPDYGAGSREEKCDHLMARGYAPERNWVEVRHVPGSPQRFWLYLYDVDVDYQWWPPDYVEDHQTICNFYTELTTEQLQSLPGEFILGSAEQGCMVQVHVEEMTP
ncbi:MAG: hypothetical protein NUW24_07210 [Anaerolineae bacterium]|jgi:hypothetical protein|nr:hypothetical protein [Anaerolineae bacterium]MDH7475508.1 hypothetical protein [Anaerolineae bacterium]